MTDDAASRDRPRWSDLFDAMDVAPSRLGEAVIERMTQAIIDGHLKPGDALPSESHIASTFGISKPIAREALRELAAMGVVQVQQGKVSRIRAVDSGPLARFYRFAVGHTQKGMYDAVELRRMLEPPVARLAAERRTSADLDELATIVARLKAGIGDVPAWIEADLAFHRHIGTMTHNSLVSLQMRGLEPLVREMMGRFNARASRTRADWRATLDCHLRIAKAIEEGDPAAAEDGMRAHFEAADEAVAEIYGQPAARPKTRSRRKPR
jgi:GntR family transcriptional regulator, transcriptional repressor for pyruvate dehydrogenase complex